ncbi:MAG TPA: NAD-dependent deacylase [Candidatus Cloacimonadota bacterium]|nr:NAD-dependent deacylase [Candidatus Cloacimonadota bacterium]HOQ79664.1 NAD-dependent deacylase [Candidatus Cloacimonadota bacterium]HPK40937.1 NAD-dependent deacylase [Candidatus Cloacimonadota bacterium]
MKTNYHIKKEDFVVILTGAGISAESGIKTFRDSDGLWENHPVEKVATPEGFRADPKLVWQFYKERYNQLSEVEPNPGHYALAELEDYLQGNFSLITQNVDDLHRRAGSKKILEMHGQLNSCFCTRCKKHYSVKDIDLNIDVPSCIACGADLRPDIVWFGEMPYFMDEIDEALRKATYFMTIGTSGQVYPAAQFLLFARSYGVKTLGVNLTEPENRSFIEEFHLGKSGEVLPKLVKLFIN